MLKFFYKTFLISVLSGSLLMLDFSYKGVMVNTLMAQTTNTATSSPSSGTKETVKTEGVKDSDLMATLTMTAVGLIASRLYTCKLTTDMMVAAAGGAAFIAGEVLATIKLKKVMKDLETEITRDPNGNVNKEQVQALERLKKSYEEAKKTAGTKKMLQMASAAAFLAAAALAYTQYGIVKGLDAACLGSLKAAALACTTTGQQLLATPDPSAATKALGAKYIAGAGETTGILSLSEINNQVADLTGVSSIKSKAEMTFAASRKTSFSATIPKCPSASGAMTTCESGYTIKMATRGVCLVPPVVITIPHALGKKLYAYAPFTPVNPINNTFAMIQRMFMSEAHADLFSPMGIVSSAAIAFVLATSATIGIQIDTFLFSPMNRAIVWGVMAGLAFAASTATDNVIGKIEANIAKIDAILNSMYSLAEGSGSDNIKNPPTATNPNTVTGTTKPSLVKASPTKYDDVDLGGGVNGNLPCFTGAESSKCKSFEETNKNLTSFTSLDLPTQQQVSGILKTADGLNGSSKISGTTLDGLARLAASANALKANADKAKSKAQDRLKLAKSKTDLDALGKKFENDLNNSVKASLKKSNSSASDMMASLYGGRGAVPDVAASSASEEEAAPKKGDPALANVIDISSPGGAELGNAGLSGIDTGSGPGSSSGAYSGMNARQLAKYNAAAKKTALDGFDLSTGEISKDNGNSIFELISNRYQQSGYPRLFKVKEPGVMTTPKQ